MRKMIESKPIKKKKKEKHNPNSNETFVMLTRRNWNNDYFCDILYRDGFDITEPPEITMDDTKEKSLYGPQSPLYGTSYSDEQAFIERYRCKCGKLMSRQFEGEICPFCHSPVEYKDADINVTGWISLGKNNYVINPYYYELLNKALGQKVFAGIINAKYKITVNGLKRKASNEDLDESPSSPYFGIGIDEFRKNFENIMKYFQGLNKYKWIS